MTINKRPSSEGQQHRVNEQKLRASTLSSALFGPRGATRRPSYSTNLIAHFVILYEIGSNLNPFPLEAQTNCQNVLSHPFCVRGKSTNGPLSYLNPKCPHYFFSALTINVLAGRFSTS